MGMNSLLISLRFTLEDGDKMNMKKFRTQQEKDMAEIDAIKHLKMVRDMNSLLAETLIDSKSERISMLGADLAMLSQRARNMLNTILYQQESN